MDLKKCKECNKEKPLNNFKSKEMYSKRKGSYIYYNPRCLNCEKLLRKKDYEENKEARIASTMKCYYKNHEKRKAYNNEYKKKNRDKMLDYYTEYYWNNRNHLLELANEYRMENKEYYNEFQKNRRLLFNSLPNTLTKDETKLIFDTFNNKCALTNSIEEVTIDHFIPVIWGHGGTYKGNVYPLTKSLNMSKGAANPFEWIKKEKIHNEIDFDSWNKLIKYLATENDMSIEDFKNYTYWCENNKRSADEFLGQGKSSAELYKETLSKSV
ncbi:hypothetical protein [Metabacillus sp. Hm71]|uniref:hypothetical protein n=1 Tax=Metabacillus sp. Hm71 TaxID=3450743 RepID=UPI003F41C70A